ncbi:conserved hypothetical protein (plasmid) [Dinoroseobacter shibae DFL 12 = DSM 16493]|jgi:hypothetical protein|uniref:DUF4112 domain-containing protein n=1 Tax=Dinoroseobacter shibae (strain DSM 16493 / NCIMB 14021 / DFL 12) TaxID=398580 RepID=A8LTS7_DINSH|nr:DUF4112 domain-containing protein [Dinoroseobacter shibae]ABV95644.1 conserved hypothetical protein [Dinoroseobacter shibae DFL 12 = DSM 16493]URF48852.1 DUF4112 domain-containing protein [Dinoroseobacter shibae]URF53164.1 DUF4112 domain-containing protein [Dinoroseobacter shibae]
MPSTSSPVANRRDRAAQFARLDRIANIFDSRFRIAGIRFGWDSILGLVPGIGDLVTAAPGVYIIGQSARMGVRRRVLARMAVNTGTDMIIGGIPLVGDIFDVGFKANQRNVRLLKKELDRDGTFDTCATMTQAQSS